MNTAKIFSELFQGFGNTVLLFAVSLVLSIPLGLLIAFGSMSKFKPLTLLVKVFIWIIRGTPLMLQILLVSFLPKYVFASSTKIWASFFGVSVSTMLFLFVIIAFVINYACYFSEIYRGGIESIAKGQYEAGQVLGLSKTNVFFKIVLPQVVKRIIPPMSNEIITLVKDTSLARIIMVYEIIWNAQKFIKSDGLLWPLFYTAVFYLFFCGILTILFGYIEKKFNYYKS